MDRNTTVTRVLIMAVLFNMAVLAQAPIGNARLRFGVNSNQLLSYLWLGSTGAAWAMADETGGNILPAFGDLPGFTLLGGTPTTCTAAVGGTAVCSLDFNGSSDYIYISDSAETSPTTTLSITTVAKIGTTTNHTLISKWGAGSNAFSMFFGEGTGSNKAQCYLIQSDGSTTVVAEGGTYTTGVWEAWTCVADGTNWKMYKNGLLVDTKSYDGTIFDSTQAMVVGSLGVGVTFFLDGQVAYTDYRKVQLNDSQVRQNYQATRTALCNVFSGTGAGTFCTDLPK